MRYGAKYPLPLLAKIGPRSSRTVPLRQLSFLFILYIMLHLNIRDHNDDVLALHKALSRFPSRAIDGDFDVILF